MCECLYFGNCYDLFFLELPPFKMGKCLCSFFKNILFSQELLDTLSKRLKEKSLVYRHDEFKDVTDIIKVPIFISERLKPIVTWSHAFSRAWRRLCVFA